MDKQKLSIVVWKRIYDALLLENLEVGLAGWHGLSIGIILPSTLLHVVLHFVLSMEGIHPLLFGMSKELLRYLWWNS